MRKLDNKAEFVNVNLTIHVRLYNKEAVKRALETLAIWGAIGEYEKKDAFRQIDEVADAQFNEKGWISMNKLLNERLKKHIKMRDKIGQMPVEKQAALLKNVFERMVTIENIGLIENQIGPRDHARYFFNVLSLCMKEGENDA